MQLVFIDNAVADSQHVIEGQCLDEEEDEAESDIDEPVLLPSVHTILAKLRELESLAFKSSVYGAVIDLRRPQSAF